MSDDRRLKLARRQLAIAQISQSAAQYALAQAITEEDRSAEVQRRSEHLLREYTERAAQKDSALESHSLQTSLAFVRALQMMADHAEKAYRDARDQAEWQMRSLAAAESRMDAHQTRVGEERRALEEMRMRREVSPDLTGASGMARKLHKHNGGRADREDGLKTSSS
ncbi:MAG: hypothetical protein AAGI28_10420 [Pseudomonadota bacterium]